MQVDLSPCEFTLIRYCTLSHTEPYVLSTHYLLSPCFVESSTLPDKYMLNFILHLPQSCNSMSVFFPLTYRSERRGQKVIKARGIPLELC